MAVLSIPNGFAAAYPLVTANTVSNSAAMVQIRNVFMVLVSWG